MLLRCGLAVSTALSLFLCVVPPRAAQAPVAFAADQPAAIRGVLVRKPSSVPLGVPLQVLVVLHGMGGNGDQIAGHVIEQAERNHWLLVAPSISYGDWTDPTQIAREEPILIRWLADYLDRLPELTGSRLRPRVLVLGHSRGAQLAHRFALFQPERVLGVAAAGAGTYTLPYERSAEGAVIGFPFGVSDMTAIAGRAFSRMRFIEDTYFWLAVGSEDTNPNDLPRAWDPYLGTTRVQRALTFQAALHALGARSVLVAFRGERHGLSADMAAGATSFLRGLDLEQQQHETRVTRSARGRRGSF